MSLQIRRYKDIVAFRSENETPIALHSRNLEVASITEEAWQALASGSFISTKAEDFAQKDEAAEEIREWNDLLVLAEPIQKPSFTIRSLTINVTQICNLHCTYCAAGGDGTYKDPIKKISIEKTLPQIQFFLDQLTPGSSFHISFLGGEPLLYPQAMKAIANFTKDQAQKKNISTSFKVTTNGTLLTEENIQILNEIGTQIVISLDGPAEINDQRRPSKTGQGSTQKILDGLKLLSGRRSQIPIVELHAVMDALHYDVEKTYEFFRSLPVDRFEFTFSVNDSDLRSSELFVQSLERAAAQAYSRGGETELRRIALFDRYFSILDNQEKIENHCGLGKTFAVIDSRNRLFNCPWTVGDEKNQIGENTDLNYERLEKYSDSLIERNKCQDCWARFICGGGCSFIHQSLNDDVERRAEKKSDFCFRTRYLTALAVRYFVRLRDAN